LYRFDFHQHSGFLGCALPLRFGLGIENPKDHSGGYRQNEETNQ
jgi:hypothetical protein